MMVGEFWEVSRSCKKLMNFKRIEMREIND